MKFSVTIPAYKDQYLKECIDSVLCQNYTNFELIIVNDASPYNLDDIVAQYNDSRIRYYKNEMGFGGLNVVGNWNKCLEYAQGDFIICMGDDDKLLPNCLEDYAVLIDKYPNLDVYHMRTEMIDEHSNLIDMQVPAPEYESVYELIWNIWKGRDQYIGDFLFRTKALKDKGGFFNLPYAWSSDKISVFMAAAKGGIANTYIPGFQYRKSTITITNTCTNQRERYDALFQEKQWYHSFFAQLPVPTDGVEKKYLCLLQDNVDKYMDSRLESMLYWDVTDTPSHYKYWKDNKDKYSISDRTLKHARFIYVKEKLRSTLKLIGL